jgi:hypothetical protein
MSPAFWDLTPCILLEINRCFGGTYCFSFQNKENQADSKQESSIKRNELRGSSLAICVRLLRGFESWSVHIWLDKVALGQVISKVFRFPSGIYHSTDDPFPLLSSGTSTTCHSHLNTKDFVSSLSRNIQEVLQRHNNLLSFHCILSIWRPPLWSSGQSSWLQIQRFRLLFPALPDFTMSSSGFGTGCTQPREDNWGTTWVEK